MKYLIFTLTIFWSIGLYSQSADSIDFNSSIMRITNDSTSKYYYPKLKDKIKNHPSEISTEDCYYLYYGQIFQKDYKPLSFVANPERPDFGCEDCSERDAGGVEGSACAGRSAAR